MLERSSTPVEYRTTPYFELDLDTVRRSYRQFVKLFPSAQIYYALKSNPFPAIVDCLLDEGCGFEVASEGELRLLLDRRVDAARVIFSNPVKPPHAIRYANSRGISKFAFDSEAELRKISTHAPAADVYMRIAVAEGGSRFSMSSKFGVALEDASRLARSVPEYNLRLAGLTFHVGSQAEERGQWTTAIHQAADVIDDLEAAGIRLHFLNIGGGFPEVYADRAVPALDDIADEVSQAWGRLPYALDLYLEPGRKLVATSGVIKTSVILKTERRGRPWLFLDVGAYNGLFEAMPYQGRTRYDIGYPPARTGVARTYVLTGPTCDSLDTITYNAVLPEDIEEGDELTIYNVGAYSLSLASQFNGFDVPPVYICD